MKTLLQSSLRDAVFGVQDGLVSTLGALTGVATGTESQTTVIIAGLVVVAVESLSMAAGSYLSSKSQRQYLEHLLAEEAKAIAKDPEGERVELWAMYRARGYTDKEITMIEKRLFNDPKLLLEDMAHKELGIHPDALENPSQNAGVMGLAYVCGGLVPLVPYFFLPLSLAMMISIGGTMAVLFSFGGAKGKLVGQGFWRSGMEMLLIAGLGALAGYGVGYLARRLVPTL